MRTREDHIRPDGKSIKDVYHAGHLHGTLALDSFGDSWAAFTMHSGLSTKRQNGEVDTQWFSYLSGPGLPCGMLCPPPNAQIWVAHA